MNHKNIKFIVFIVSILSFYAISRSLELLRPISWIDSGAYARTELINAHHAIKKALFSPDDNIKRILIGLIAEEQESIKMAAFSLTDIDIAHELAAAYARGIMIEIVVDGKQADTDYSKVFSLAKCHIPIFVYPKDAEKRWDEDGRQWYSLMHNKFIIFGKSLTGKKLLWTGSFNFTRSASFYNQENVIVEDDQDLADRFEAHFELLKTRCKKHTRYGCQA